MKADQAEQRRQRERDAAASLSGDAMMLHHYQGLGLALEWESLRDRRNFRDWDEARFDSTLADLHAVYERFRQAEAKIAQAEFPRPRTGGRNHAGGPCLDGPVVAQGQRAGAVACPASAARHRPPETADRPRKRTGGCRGVIRTRTVAW